MELRRATIDDLSLLRHWDEQSHIIAADPNDDWAWEIELERSPDWREQLIAQIDGLPSVLSRSTILLPATLARCGFSLFPTRSKEYWP